MLKHYRSLFVLAFIITLIMTSGCTSNSPTSPGEEDPFVELDGLKENNIKALSLEESFPQANEGLRAPSGLTADISGYIPGEVESNGRIDLTWIDHSLNEVSFLIERKVDDGLWVLYAQVDAGAISYSDLDLEADKTFTYRVQAVSAEIHSDYSNEASVFTGMTGFNPKPTT